MNKKIITGVIILASLGLIGFILSKNKASNEAKTAVVAENNATVVVKTDTVKTEAVNQDFVSNGTFAPSQEIAFAAEKSGKVISVLVKEGDRVSAGQTMAVVRGDVINVEAQTANANYQNALNDYNRFENAYKTGGVTKQQLDQAKINMINAKSRLTQANINVGDTRIKAPFSGIINKKYIEVGTILSGMPPTQMFEIVNVSRLKLKVTVNENQVSSLKLGAPVKVTATVFPDKTFDGKITFIAPKADASLNFAIEVEIANNPSGDLKAGMYGTANFVPTSTDKTPLMIVPRTAFVGSVSANEIFVVEKGGSAKLKKVTAGRIFGEQVEILSGLSNGDIVITSGQINLTDGTKVTVLK
jgi:RND family efflux transporter MFP subunit